ncbi:hypothetical protein [Pseudoxanthomonas sp. z9]|uniref:hypothetical protein n=1 Tax=Pseudoxanthomonas sp. z9 TaxID=2584942 RepID=UPI0011438090|nr:hypothetical protein [Pseudoxanthomonas sp. z9]MCL6711299.1 hypothetical protein [Pseudomonas sp. R2.Fl]
MSSPRPGMAGATRTCPHCKTTILESAAICPACRHHLRFDEASLAAARTAQTVVPLKVEGSVRHPADGGPWEYSVVMSIRNDRGEEVTRQVVGVGAMQPGEQRTFTLSVEMFPRPGGRGPRR